MKVWISGRTCPSLSLIPIPSHKLINQCPDPISFFSLYTLLVLFHQSQATVKPETIYSNCITRTRLILPYLESYTQPSLSEHPMEKNKREILLLYPLCYCNKCTKGFVAAKAEGNSFRPLF